MSEEQWLPISEYQQIYEVSDQGNVRCVVSGTGYRIETTKEIAKRYKIAQCTVSAIHVRRIWKEVM